MSIRSIFALTVLCDFLSGCGTAAFVPPQSQPVLRNTVSDKNGVVEAVTLATTAERREVIYRPEDGKVCFEAPPDAADAISSQFSGALQAAVSKGSLDATASASLGTSVSNAIASLAKRSQGVILYRDAAFNLCMANLNGALSNQQYAEQLDKLSALVVPIIQDEIDRTNGKIGPDLTVVSNPAAGPVNNQILPAKPVAAPVNTPAPDTSSLAPKSVDTSAAAPAEKAGDAAATATAAAVAKGGGNAAAITAASSAAKDATVSAVNSGANPVDAATAAATTAASAAVSGGNKARATGDASSNVKAILSQTQNQATVLSTATQQIQSQIQQQLGVLK